MKIFCSGIGGIGLSAYAMHMVSRGHVVHGSDRAASALTDSLEKEGIPVAFVQDGSALDSDTDLLVYSEAIPESSPERVKAKECGIRQVSYFQALGELAQGKTVICVCGTHGKSSTTAMAARMLMEAGKNPSVIVGTKMFELEGKNYRLGDPDLWVMEACEYRRSFLHLHPTIILLTNIDGDHFDAFSSLEDYHHAYTEFIAALPPDGVVISHLRDPALKDLLASSHGTIRDADEEPLIELASPGEHMRQNAQLVLSLGELLGISREKTERYLKGYRGSWRRMEERGVIESDVLVVDDYAHHPVEIRATIAAMKERHPDRRMVTVFQPHTHDRTLSFWKEFTTCFTGTDVFILTDIYDARPDIEKELVDRSAFLRDVEKGSHASVVDGISLEKTEEMLPSVLKPHDLLLIMGAGNISDLADSVMKK